MQKEDLKTVIIDQREEVSYKLKTEKIVKREGLLECRKFLAYPNVLLISGIRRSGKSIFSHLLAKDTQYAYINFDDERLFGLSAKDLNVVLECFYELYDKIEIIILDEIQNIKGWELFVNRLRNKYRLMVTGSNANLLSSEMATHLTGRFISFPVFPLSFKEFLDFNSINLNKNSIYSTRQRSKITSLFDQYLMQGGIFEYYKFGDEFLRELFSSIIAKDIVARYKIRFPAILEELGLLLINNFSAKISLSNLSKSLQVKSPHTIKQYLKYLENTFLVSTINKFSYKVKEQLSTFKKIYIADNGFIHALALNFSRNKGRQLENLVAMELLKRGKREDFKIFYWDNYNVECDFIIKKARKISAAIQVCWEISLTNREREISGLTKALEEFDLNEGLILTQSMEEEIQVGRHKIKIRPVWKWLLD